jgi:hypothetical protein
MVASRSRVTIRGDKAHRLDVCVCDNRDRSHSTTGGTEKQSVCVLSPSGRAKARRGHGQLDTTDCGHDRCCIAKVDTKMLSVKSRVAAETADPINRDANARVSVLVLIFQ